MSKNIPDELCVPNVLGQITIYKQDVGLCFDIENFDYKTLASATFTNTVEGKDQAKQVADALYAWIGVRPAKEQQEEIISLKQQNQKAKEIIKRFCNYFAKGTPDLADAREFLSSGFSNT